MKHKASMADFLDPKLKKWKTFIVDYKKSVSWLSVTKPR